MITVGVDLASQPERTGLCVLEWGAAVRCIELRVGVTDQEIVAAAVAGNKCGIDAPFGWPDDFVASVAAHHAGDRVAIAASTERLRMRATDLWVWRHHGRRPLSVSTDLIGVPALRCARLQSMVAAATGQPVDRSGAGLLVETYPAAALQGWGLPWNRYKRTAPNGSERLAGLAGAVEARFGISLEAEPADLLSTNDDAFDAMVCAIVARLAASGHTDGPPPELAGEASREGWIHVPTAAPPL